MAGVTLEEANRRYTIMYDMLNQGKGWDGLLYWEKLYYNGRIDHYTLSRIIGQNRSHNPTSFNDYVALLIPPESLLVAPGTT